MQEIIPLSPKIAETHHSSLIQLNKKLKVYSLFKQDSKKSHYLDLIKNTNHRRTVAKFRTRNHKLMIEYGRYRTPKIPEHLRLCQYCSINEIDDEQHFMINCTLYLNERQWARSIRPKFRPVRPKKEDHLKRWTRFFETFPVGPNRSIEFWTEISGKFG